MNKTELKYNLKRWSLLTVFFELLFWVIAFQFFRFFGYFYDKEAGERITFLEPQYAWFLLLIPIYIGLLTIKVVRRNKMIDKSGGFTSIHSFLKPVNTNFYFWNYFMVRNILVFTVFALMQPAFGEKTTPMKSSGIEMVFALDISNSMNVRDMTSNSSRLEAAQKAMKQFVKVSSAAKLGLVVFAGGTYPQLPLTADKGLVKLHIDELSTDLISTQGTNISAALILASDYFSKENFRKVVVLITDGEDHEGGGDEMIEQYNKKGIELYVLGLGTSKGGLVPKDPNYTTKGYLKDELGRSVISYLNKDMINSIASKAKTEAYITNDAYPNINSLLTQINKRKATDTVDLEFKVKQNRYYIPLWIALFFTIVKIGVDVLKVRGKISV
jgi:Ca-activated chloride channel family protein